MKYWRNVLEGLGPLQKRTCLKSSPSSMKGAMTQFPEPLPLPAFGKASPPLFHAGPQGGWLSVRVWGRAGGRYQALGEHVLDCEGATTEGRAAQSSTKGPGVASLGSSASSVPWVTRGGRAGRRACGSAHTQGRPLLSGELGLAWL